MTAKKTRSKESRRNNALKVAIEALALYANPESYHAISMYYDRPCGWFGGDVSKALGYDRKMHGAAARKALNKMEKIICDT